MIHQHHTQAQVATTTNRRIGAFGLAVAMTAGLLLSGCNTAAGVGKDVAATGAAVTRSANDVKSGL
jgi:predicted small secreted protein